MDKPLLTWADNAAAIDELIARAERTLDVIDQDLSLQGWETLARAEALRVAMHDRAVQIRLIVNDAKSIASTFPRLRNLLKTHGHRMTVLQTRAHPKPEQFIAVADGQHSIFRPVLVQSRGFAYFDNLAKSTIYTSKVNVVWEFGGLRVFPEAFGL
jgi:hypothetical protein